MRESLRWCLPVAFSVASLAFGQQIQQLPAPAPGGDINADAMRGKESAQGVYVRDSAIALEKFALAQRMQDLKEWAKAADLYQEVLEKFADRVVPSQVDKDNNIYQYISVIAAVQQKMSKWPAEGLEVYRQRYETAAQAILEGAKVDDRTAMQMVLNRYFPTETAKQAGMRLMDLYLESGEFAAAAWMGEQLLAGHPNLIVERPKVLYRCALSYHLAGDTERSKAKAAELAAKYADETGTVRGVDVKLTESLTAEIAQGVAPVQTLADSAWPQFGGSNDHARISTAAGKPGAKLYHVELTKPNYPAAAGGNREQVRQLQDADERAERSGGTLGVFPVIDRGEMFFQDGTRVYAVSVEGGQPLPGWAQTYPGDRKGQFQLPGAGRYSARGQFNAITLTDNSVLAIMGQSDRRAAMMGLPTASPGEGRVVCLDRATGKERWVIHPRNMPEEAQQLRNCEFSGSVLVVENNVYVSARSSRGGNQGNPFEDCYLLCFDLETGKYKWNCYIASANNFGSPYGWDGESPITGESIAQLAYSSGRLYVLTNLGALAAVDAYGGRIVWLSIYPRDPQLANNMMGGRRAFMPNVPAHLQQADKPWHTNPAIIDNGRVFILPSDGRFIHAYDAGAGIELKRIDAKHFDTATCLIAVIGPRMVLTGGKTMTYVDWEKYNIEKFQPRTRLDSKPDPSLVGTKVLPTEIRGRTFVANGSAYVSTDANLFVVDLAKVKVTQVYPNPKTWEKADAEGPGNVLVSDDHVIISANRRIDVYTDMDAARRKLDAKIAANAKAPDPRLEYAEVMFVAGDTNAALAKLDEAIELLGGKGNMQTGPARDKLFAQCMNFAQRLSRGIKDKNHENLSVVQSLFDRAAVAAQNPSQQVSYRMQRAQLENTVGDYPLAVRLYQEIIADPQLRTIPTLDEQSSVQSGSGIVARRLIDNIIRNRGASPYVVFEQQAAAELEKVKAGGSPEDLVNFANTYPNAKVAPQALLAAADIRDAGGDPRGAVQLLRQVYLSYPNFSEKRRVLESLARNYLAMPNRTGVAVARLSEAAKLGGNEKLSKPLALPDGKQLNDISLNQAVEELKKVRVQEVARTLPDFGLPTPPSFVNEKGIKTRREPFLPHTQEMIIPEVTALLSPSRDATRYDRVAYYARGAVHINAIGENKPLASLPMGDQPTGLTWTNVGPLIWTNTTAQLLKGDSSTVAWAFETKGLGAVEAVAAVPTQGENTDAEQPRTDLTDEEIVMMNNGVLRQQMMANQRIGRRMVIVNGQIREIPNNQQAGKAVVGGNETIIGARPVGDFVLFTTSSGRIVAVELADGRIRWQTRLADRLPERIVADEDFTVLFQRDDMGGATITALDSFTGQMVGRRVFGAETGQVPSNLALAPDGTLVYLMPSRIVLKNLYESWSNPERDIKINQPNNPPFMSSSFAEQLQIVDGRILVVSDQGTNLRGYSMESLKPLRYSPDGKQEQDMILNTGARGNEEVKLKVVGSQAYLIGPRTLRAYNLDSPDRSWQPWVSDAATHETISDSFIGRNHLVLLKDTKKRVNPNQVLSYRLYAHARYSVSENDAAEVGRCDYNPFITDPAGVKTVQGVEGGFYYLTVDQKLHFLKSSPAN